MKINENELVRLYKSDAAGLLDTDLLWKIGGELFMLCQSELTKTQKDYDAGDDMSHFASYYLSCFRANNNSEKVRDEGGHLEDPTRVLMWEIDVLMHGCHAGSAPASGFGISIEVLDSLFKS